jgi:hypothetical protein
LYHADTGCKIQDARRLTKFICSGASCILDPASALLFDLMVPIWYSDCPP